jgi:hypothetical protein
MTTKSKAMTLTLRRGLCSYLVVRVVEDLKEQIVQSFVRAFFMRVSKTIHGQSMELANHFKNRARPVKLKEQENLNVCLKGRTLNSTLK